MAAQPTAVAPPGPFAPFAEADFRALWCAVLLSNIGTWMHDVAAAWLMAEMTAAPLMVAAVQAATSIPVVLLAIMAGALADIVDRRRYLILAQLWMLASASALAVLVQSGQLQPWSLLALTLALGVGAAMSMPAQAATTPELVPRALLAPAVALTAASMNIARTIGPALGGLIIARWGAHVVFALNALSFLAVIIVLWRWRRAPASTALPPERFGNALRAGLRYAARASVFRAVLLKAASFFIFASALPALLPLVVRTELRAGPGSYGILLGCIGIGALAGALALPRLRARMDHDHLLLAASVLSAVPMLGLARVRELWLLGALLGLYGMAWISVLSTLQVAAQTAVPAWVRARALSLYFVVFAAGMALGSLAWGALAQHAGLATALLSAAAGVVVAAAVALRFRLHSAESLDLAPSGHWPEPVPGESLEHDRGPVLVTVEYLIDLEDRLSFLDRMQALGRSRQRDGAVQWGIMEDVARPGTYLEYFLVASWLEHLRQHERVTGEERRLQDTLRRLHQGAQAPIVRHFIGGPPGGTARLSDRHEDI